MKKTTKHLFLGSLLVCAFAASLSAQPIRLTARQHYDVTVNGRVTAHMTELMYTRGDRQDGFVTLLSDNQGRRFIFSFSENYAEKRTSIEVRDLGRNLFLRGSFVLPYTASTIVAARAEKKNLPRESFRVPMTIETNSFADSQFVDDWHNGAGATKRISLQRHVDGQLVGALRSLSGGALSAGSPAIMYACDYLMTVVAEDVACNRRLGVEAVEKDDDCAFDATFGYPCGSH
jgi:hypothetical protein